MLAGAAVIFVLVMALLARPLLRRAPGAGRAGGTDRAWLAGGGLVFPLLVLSVLLAYGLAVGERLLASPAGDAWQVEARAAQWQWRFRHAAAQSTIERVNRLDIPAGRPVDVRVSSDDVIHSFWVPRLAGKVDAIPGKVNTLRIEAAAPGTYEARCAEYCGTGHTAMRFVVVAHNAAAWAAWLEGAGR